MPTSNTEKKKLQVPAQRVFGRLHTRASGRLALELLPKGDESSAVYLRYALTEMGTEKPLFPALLLDDWGNELRGLGMYQWVRTNGELFPRAEMFGYDNQWKEAQWFLRILEIYARYPCYGYPDRETPQEEGIRVTAVLLPDPSAAAPEKTVRPFETELSALFPTIAYPFEEARLNWWHIHPEKIAEFVA